MTHRSRSGGPGKTYGKKKDGQPKRKLHHPPPPPRSPSPPPPVVAPNARPLPPREGPFNPPDTELLALIHRALHSTLSSDEFPERVQHIKGLLYDKKWLEVFCGGEEVLETYAGRWVPGRACCFRELMAGLVGELFGQEEGRDEEEEEGVEAGMEKLALREEEEEGDEDDEDEDEEEAVESSAPPAPSAGPSTTPAAPPQTPHHILSLGGGAGSELLAISALIRSTLLSRSRSSSSSPTPDALVVPKWSWTGIDIGRWSSVLQKLERTVRDDWGLTEADLSVEYIQGDLMAPASKAGNVAEESFAEAGASRPVDLTGLLTAKPPTLITLFFTLSELLSQSRPATLSLLTLLTSLSPPGTLFLIADAASDISEVSLGAGGRKWPVWMMMDLLLGGEGRGWERVRGEESRWFRFEEGVGEGWVTKLENTRYWYRLYRRV
ncbi:hypothetical protein IAT38_001607 [Cryptococcus sp. DSM 104549]